MSRTSLLLFVLLSTLTEGAFAVSETTPSSQPASCSAADLSKLSLAEELAKTIPAVGQELYTTHAGYQRMKSAVNLCQNDAYLKCYPELKPSINKGVVERLFREWMHRRHYKLADPSGLCYNRAYLLSRELAELGYSAQLIHMDPSPAIVSITRNDDGIPTHHVLYEKHWVVQVLVTDAAGISKQMILDPQFAMAPMERKAYFTEVSGQDCVPGARVNVADCVYNVRQATFQLYPVPDIKPALAEQCGWSRTEDLTAEIEKALSVMPLAFKPLPMPYEELRANLLKTSWDNYQFWINFEIQSLEKTGLDTSKRKLDLQNVIERRAQIHI